MCPLGSAIYHSLFYQQLTDFLGQAPLELFGPSCFDVRRTIEFGIFGIGTHTDPPI
jgi:hypothetical protein